MPVFIAIGIVLSATVMVFIAADFAAVLPLSVAANQWISVQFNFQLLLVFLAALVLITVYVQNPQAARQYFGIGKIAAPLGDPGIFGKFQGNSWVRVGLGLSIIVGFLTWFLLFFQQGHVEPGKSFPFGALVWVLVFSLMNAFSEEVIFRLALVAPLDGQLSANSIAMLSGFIFGIAHVGGSPGGVPGMLVAGVLGWFLARSMLETRGMFWAVIVHFAQNVVIFSAFILQTGTL